MFTSSGLPVRNAFVEIWQTDAHGSYVHTGGRQATKPYDANFQGYGRFLSDAKGQYYFRTIKPVEYTLMGASSRHSSWSKAILRTSATEW